MNAALQLALQANFKALNLNHLCRQLETAWRQAQKRSLDYGEFLLDLTQQELQQRAANRLQRRLREAKFALLKTLEQFSYEAAPGLEPWLVRRPAGGEYLSQHRNVFLLGKSGTGKTHLAIGLGIAACQ